MQTAYLFTEHYRFHFLRLWQMTSLNGYGVILLMKEEYQFLFFVGFGTIIIVLFKFWFLIVIWIDYFPKIIVNKVEV